MLDVLLEDQLEESCQKIIFRRSTRRSNRRNIQVINGWWYGGGYAGVMDVEDDIVDLEIRGG